MTHKQDEGGREGESRRLSLYIHLMGGGRRGGGGVGIQRSLGGFVVVVMGGKGGWRGLRGVRREGGREGEENVVLCSHFSF